MLSCIRFRRPGAVIAAVLAAAALCAGAAAVYAANECPPGTSQPAVTGAGPAAMGFASNVGSQAWIYTDDPQTSTPTQVSGSIQLSVTDASPMDSPDSRDAASMSSSFTYGGADYVATFTGLQSTADAFTHFGGVGINRPILGSTGIPVANMPPSLAYISAFGTASIARSGQSIATDQPAMAFVTQAVHDTNQSWLSSADPTRQEIHLFVPGSMMDSTGTAVPGFPKGGFYIYWPSAAFELRNIGGVVSIPGVAATTTTTTTTPATRVGRGPGPVVVHSLNLSISNTGISRISGDAVNGLHQVTVTNNSSRSRGLVISGADLAGSPYTRFTPVLRPGQSRTFQWFFAPGTVTVRDYVSARKTGTGYANVRRGGLSASLGFS